MTLLLCGCACCPAAKSVTACDFMDVSIEENKRQHAALGNVDFLVADVTEMEQVCGVVQRTLVGFQGVVWCAMAGAAERQQGGWQAEAQYGQVQGGWQAEAQCAQVQGGWQAEAQCAQVYGTGLQVAHPREGGPAVLRWLQYLATVGMRQHC
jgi:hypothetical protein